MRPIPCSGYSLVCGIMLAAILAAILPGPVAACSLPQAARTFAETGKTVASRFLADDLTWQATHSRLQQERAPRYAEDQMLWSQELPVLPLFVGARVRVARRA